MRRAVGLLYTHNPFYLLSVAFVLHSTRLWLNTRAWPYDPWPLMYIIGGYIVLVATVGGLVIRLARAWDDARSILLILLLLFVELSLTFDPVVVGQPRLGLTLLLTGWVLAVLVSEGLFWGLGIRLRLFFRAPYHLLLALLFLYPPLIVLGLRTETVSAIWRIWAFSPVASLALLTLLPAIRRGPEYVRQNGTPWSWPWFPWGLFCFLGVCLGVRAYALTLSFDSVLTQNLQEAMRLQSAFSPFFVNPLVLAGGLLLLEAGIVSGNLRLQRIGIAAPLLACALASWFPNTSAPAADFLGRFTEQVGSPLWLAVWGGLVFCTYAWLRRVKDAAFGITAFLMLVGMIGRRDVAWTSLQLHAWPLWIVAFVLGIEGIRSRRARELFLAGAATVMAARFVWLPHAFWMAQIAVPLQLMSVWAVLLGMLFKDAWGSGLRAVGLVGLVVSTLLGATWLAESPPGWTSWMLVCDLAVLTVGTILLSYAIHSRVYFFVGVGMLLISFARVLQMGAQELESTAQWKGAGFFVIGLVWLALATLISSAKAGLGKYLIRLLPAAGTNREEERAG